MSLPFRVSRGFGGGVAMVLHHYMSYFSPCSFKDRHYHILQFGVAGGGGIGGGPGWFFITTCQILSLHVRFFPMFFQRSMSLPFRVRGVGVRPDGSSSLITCQILPHVLLKIHDHSGWGVFFFWRGPGSSPGIPCELPRPHDDDDDDDEDDDDDDEDDDDDDDENDDDDDDDDDHDDVDVMT